MNMSTHFYFTCGFMGTTYYLPSANHPQSKMCLTAHIEKRRVSLSKGDFVQSPFAFSLVLNFRFTINKHCIQNKYLSNCPSRHLSRPRAHTDSSNKPIKKISIRPSSTRTLSPALNANHMMNTSTIRPITSQLGPHHLEVHMVINLHSYAQNDLMHRILGRFYSDPSESKRRILEHSLYLQVIVGCCFFFEKKT